MSGDSDNDPDEDSEDNFIFDEYDDEYYDEYDDFFDEEEHVIVVQKIQPIQPTPSHSSPISTPAHAYEDEVNESAQIEEMMDSLHCYFMTWFFK